MAQVVIEVNGHPYTMQCNDGEEEHLTELAELLDSEVAAIRRGVGQVGDIRLLLMAGLVIADRLSESVQRIEALEAQVQGMRQNRAGKAGGGNGNAAETIGRIEDATRRLEAMARDAAGGSNG